MAAHSVVTLLQTSAVVPSRPTARHLMYLSSLDLQWRDIHYNLRVVFYELGPSSEFSEVVAKLKLSLGEVLVHFFPLAGRLAKEGEDGRFGIDCNDAGVEFVEAKINASFEDMGDNFDFKPFFADLTRLGHLTRSDLPEHPLLSVQITQFLGGGIALGISHSHVVMDGPSLWHFMLSWSECARGLPLSKPPIHMRTAFKPEKVSHGVARLIPFELAPMSVDGGQMARLDPPVDKVFHCSSEAMRKFKEMGLNAKSEGDDGPKRTMSALEVLYAHCWRHVTRARCLERETKLSFVVLADWRRRRLSSPAPVEESYFGNAITWTAAYATPGTLLNESFGATLARMAAAVDECTHPNTLHGTIHWLELHDTRFQLGAFWFPGVTINIASSPRFPVYRVDFGWGPPACARPVRVPAIGELCLLPGRDGGIDVCAKLDSLSLQRLVDDPLFLCPS